MRLPILPLAAVLALGACAAPTAISVASPQPLFHDERFAPAHDPDLDADIFALSDGMRDYLRDAGAELRRGLPRSLIQALYQHQRLQLDYDGARTRNAAEAFAVRRGNCLSLVIMTAALARALDLPVVYQAVDTEASWNRRDDLLFVSHHVNLRLARRFIDRVPGFDPDKALVVDFLPPAQADVLDAHEIPESTIVAMYRNNRAAESLASGDIDAAYWWARRAVQGAPALAGPYNTLGVVYLRHGDLAAARQVLTTVLERNPEDRQGLSNLAIVYDRLGLPGPAADLRRQLARVEPDAPYRHFFAGKAAMARGDYAGARASFEQEVSRAPYCSEFHFWLGLADLKLGMLPQAREEITLAMENSTTDGDYAVYAGKLAHLQRVARAAGG